MTSKKKAKEASPARSGSNTLGYAAVLVIALASWSGSVATSNQDQVGETFKDCSDCPEMVLIPAGSFQMGDVSGGAHDDDTDEEPVHRVTIPNDFAVGKYEVTKDQFAAFVTATGHETSAEKNAGGTEGCNVSENGNRSVSKPGTSWRSPGFVQAGEDPVVCVSWDDAQEYVQWLSGKTNEKYRLLSESEWEYAARAGTDSQFSWGNEIGHNRANCNGCGSQWDLRKPAPVGRFEANGYGLYDMHGNVWEWTADVYHYDYIGAPTDGSVWETGGDSSIRSARSGAWYSVSKNTRSANRMHDGKITNGRLNFQGFRIARDR